MARRTQHPRLARATALAAAATLLFTLAACGSADDTAGAPSETTTGAATGPPSPEFCEAITALNIDESNVSSDIVNPLLDQLVATAPSAELRQAATTLQEVLGSSDIFEVLAGGVDPTDPVALDELQAKFDEVNTPEVVAASEEIEAYAVANCAGGSAG